MAYATTVEQERDVPLVRGVRLVVASGPDAGAAVAVDGEVLIGTSEGCDLRLTDRASRRLVVRPCALGAHLIDQGSRNGTWLGEQRIHDAELAPGAEVRLGNTTLRLEAWVEPGSDATRRNRAALDRTGRGS